MVISGVSGGLGYQICRFYYIFENIYGKPWQIFLHKYCKLLNVESKIDQFFFIIIIFFNAALHLSKQGFTKNKKPCLTQ